MFDLHSFSLQFSGCNLQIYQHGNTTVHQRLVSTCTCVSFKLNFLHDACQYTSLIVRVARFLSVVIAFCIGIGTCSASKRHCDGDRWN